MLHTRLGGKHLPPHGISRICKFGGYRLRFNVLKCVPTERKHHMTARAYYFGFSYGAYWFYGRCESGCAGA